MKRAAKGSNIQTVMLTVALINVIITSAATDAAPPAPQGPSLGACRAMVRQLFDGKTAKLWAESGPALRQQLSAEAFAGFSSRVRSFGRELRVISEGLSARGQHTVYRRVSAFSRFARGAELELVLDEGGRLVGVSSRSPNKEAPTTAGRYRTKAELRLPFEGGWFVLWGGRTWADNRHSTVPDQRYALDLLQLRGAGTFERDGSKNEHYAAWGKPVLAPGDGVVVEASDGTDDNDPKAPAPINLYGNYVVIDHGTGEFSLLAHLQKSSLEVKVGQHVRAGLPIAKCGNSGMSSEPHLHYQLMDSARWAEAQGLPAQFRDYTANGRVIGSGEPHRGEWIAPQRVYEARNERR